MTQWDLGNKAVRRGLLYSFSEVLQKKLKEVKILQFSHHLLGANTIRMKNWRVTFMKHSDQLSLQPRFLFADSDRLSFKLMLTCPLMTLIWEKAKHRRWNGNSLLLISMWKPTQTWWWSSWRQGCCWRLCHAPWLFPAHTGSNKDRKAPKAQLYLSETGSLELGGTKWTRQINSVLCPGLDSFSQCSSPPVCFFQELLCLFSTLPFTHEKKVYWINQNSCYIPSTTSFLHITKRATLFCCANKKLVFECI